MPKSKAWRERIAFFFVIVALADPAYAYLDPGTGTAITGTILGFFGAAIYTGRKYLYKVRDVFARKKRGGVVDNEE
jgi:hypothetical protein